MFSAHYISLPPSMLQQYNFLFPSVSPSFHLSTLILLIPPFLFKLRDSLELQLLPRMINKASLDVQKCPNCQNCFLQRIGSEYYCNNCQQFKLLFQEEVRVVPSKYQSNCKTKKQLEQERRLNALIREFTDKYRDASADEIKLFRQRLASIKDMTPRKKGSRQAAGVVVFVSLNEEIKQTIRQFCHHNNLSIKLFNQKYKIYQKLYKNVHFQSQEQEEQLKIEQKLEQSSPTEKSLTQVASTTAAPVVLDGSRHAISLIFDDVFNKYIYRSKKPAIIDSLLKRMGSVDRQMLQKIKYFDNPPLKLYYLIFAVIKTLGHKINYLQYSEIIRTKTGYLMKRKAACEVKKVYERFSKEKAVKEEYSKEESEQLSILHS